MHTDRTLITARTKMLKAAERFLFLKDLGSDTPDMRAEIDVALGAFNAARKAVGYPAVDGPFAVVSANQTVVGLL